MNYGILSVIPSLLAIVLALLTKNVIIALLASLLAGNLILAGYQPMNALVGLKDAMINVFSDHSSTSIIFILLMLGGLFCLIEKSGGLSGFTTLMVEKGKLIHSKKGAALFTWLVGVLIFIDGTLSVMLTGSVSRPLAKAFRMSPEKNAWIVHSTSTPMSILIPIAAYGPYIASFIEAQGIENPTGQMVSAIGFNFYCILAVAGVALFLLFGIEFGPMKKAEQAYANATGGETTETAQTQASAGGKARHLLIPLAVMVVVTIAYILYSGGGSMTAGDAESGLIFGIVSAAVYLMVDLAISKRQKIGEGINTFLTGCGNMISIAAIMVLAYTLSGMISQLGTAGYLSSLLTRFMAPAVFSAVAFLFTCIISFSTGTSAGTIAIMMPILLPMAVSFGTPIPLIVGAIAGGAVFGDHTSPISDTTIMSCSSTGCNVVSHVKTQLPYALCFAGAALLLYLVLGFIL